METVDIIVLAVAVVAVVLALAALVAARRAQTRVTATPAPARGSQDAHDGDARPAPASEPEPKKRAAVVINPSKFGDPAPLRAALEGACWAEGWEVPLWLETSAEDPGIGQTREALEAGVDLVVACGGDGTVRCVGQVLAGTGVPMGLAPAGTGNLLARNLDVVTPRTAEMTPDDAEAAMRAALTGVDRPIDVGWITITGADGSEHTDPEEKAFLVMAGMGFDAAMMANAPEALKAKVGPIAYVVSGVQQVNGKRTRVRLVVDGDVHQRKVRTVVIGNVGRLLGGLTLMPDAEVDDGFLDVVAIGPRNIAQWLDVLGRVVLRRNRSDERMDTWRGREVILTSETPLEAQIDGDPVGEAVALTMRVAEHALLVRVAPGAGAKKP